MQEPFRSLPQATQRYILIVSVAYGAAAVWALLRVDLPLAAVLAGIFALGTLVRPVSSPLGGISDPNSGLVIVAALLWRPAEVLIGVGIGSFIGLLLFRKNEVWRCCINGAGWGLPAGAATLVAHGATSAISPGLVSLIAGAVLAVTIYRVINTGIFAVYRSQRFGRPFLPEWRQTVIMWGPSQLLAAPMAVVLAAIAHRIEAAWAGLALTAAYAMMLPVARQEYAYYIRSREMLDETVEAVVRALEGVDPAARAHGDRVSGLAAETGRRMGMPERGLLALRLAARLHDVGLLAEAEGEVAKGYDAVVGGRILTQFPDPMIAQFVRAHHERWDGEGVPDGLRGKAIPLGARILAAAEVYDSLQTGLSPSGAPRTQDEVANRLVSLAGNALDPKVVAVLLQVAGEHNTGIPETG